MNLKLDYLNAGPSANLLLRVKQLMLVLGRARRINAARVRLIPLHEAGPSFEVDIHLVTPGPEVITTGRDHAFHAAIPKAVPQLRERIARRRASGLPRPVSGRGLRPGHEN